jgi:SAM-dependent methyltransferase
VAAWLAGPRGRALRRARIGLRRRVLEVGCGHGVVTEELRRRAAGEVVSLDVSPYPGASLVADATHLPFPDASFDLVFFQNVLLWVADRPAAVAEAARVLQPGGDLVALEPDYGGMMEYPDLGLAAVWRAALTRAGADPLVGRKLPGLCEEAGLQVWVELTHLPQPAHPDALRLLERHELTEAERRQVEAARRALAASRGQWGVFLHVPYFVVVAGKR